MKREFKAGIGTPRNLLRKTSKLTNLAYKNVLLPALREAVKDATGRTIMSGIQSTQDENFSPVRILSRAFPNSKPKSSMQRFLSESSRTNIGKINDTIKRINSTSLIPDFKKDQTARNHTRKNDSKILSTPRKSKKFTNSIPRRPKKKRNITNKQSPISKISPLKLSEF